MPITPPCHHLEADNIWTLELDLLDGKLLRLAVENCDAAAVIARRRLRHHPKSVGFLCVNSVGEFCFLQYSTTNLFLSQTVKCWFQTSILSIPGAICAEPYHFLWPPSEPLSLPGKPLCSNANTLPLENIFSISVRPPLVHTHHLSSLTLSPLHHRSIRLARAPVTPFNMPSIPLPLPDRTLLIGYIT